MLCGVALPLAIDLDLDLDLDLDWDCAVTIATLIIATYACPTRARGQFDGIFGEI